MKRKPWSSVGRERRSEAGASASYRVTMSEVDPAVCWRLVAKTQFGRVAFIRHGEPWVLPVNCAVLDDAVLFRTASHSMLHRLAPHSVVAFEADGVDRVAESGWSVLMRGLINELDDEADVAKAAATGLTPWGPGPRHHWMCIKPFEVSGRIIAHGVRSRRDPAGPGQT